MCKCAMLFMESNTNRVESDSDQLNLECNSNRIESNAFNIRPLRQATGSLASPGYIRLRDQDGKVREKIVG